MAAVALMKFTQGPNTDVAGRAVVGTLFSVDGSVTVTNDNNTDVSSWEITLLDAPPDSSNYPIGTLPVQLAAAATSTPSATFDPDVPGSYRVLMDVVEVSGARNRDIRCFAVPNERGLIVPPYQKNPDPLPLPLPGVITPITTPASKPDEQNYSGQPRGWAGDRADGQLEQTIKTVDDTSFVLVSSSPFTATKDTQTHILLAMATIGGPATVTLPADARVGQTFFIRDIDGVEEAITISTSGGQTFKNFFGAPSIALGPTRFLNVGVIFLGGGEWMLFGTNLKEFSKNLVHGVESTDATGFTRIGGVSLDPLLLGGQTLTLEILLESSDAGATAEFRLFNLTDATAVGASVLTTSSTIPTKLTADLVVGTDLASVEKVYEAQIRRTGGVAGDRAICSYAVLDGSVQVI